MVEADAVLEVADHVFDLGVAAVIGVQRHGGSDPVGDERVVVPGREQLALGGQVADPAHDQPVALVGGLGDLGHARVGVADRRPPFLADALDRLADRLGLAHGDRVAHAVAAQPLAGGGCPESRVHPDGELAAGAGAADPADQLIDEPGHAAGGVGPPGSQPGVQHLAAAGPGCQ